MDTFITHFVHGLQEGGFLLKLEGRLKSTTRLQQFLRTIWAASCYVVSRRVAQHRDVVDINCFATRDDSKLEVIGDIHKYM